MKLNVLLATTSKGKIAQYMEIANSSFFKDERKYLRFYTLKSNARLREIPEVEETGETFLENAVRKAQTYGKYSGMVTISDDSGLIVPALDFCPGVHSHRDGWTPEKVIQKMRGKSGRNASLQTVCAWYSPQHGHGGFHDFDLDGYIVEEEDGGIVKSGYGYDDIFIPKYVGKPVTQALAKNSVSRLEMSYPRSLTFSDTLVDIIKYYQINKDKKNAR